MVPSRKLSSSLHKLFNRDRKVLAVVSYARSCSTIYVPFVAHLQPYSLYQVDIYFSQVVAEELSRRVCHNPAPLHTCTVLRDQDEGESSGAVQKVDNDLKDCLKYVQEVDYQAACHADWWQGGMCLERTGDIRNGVRSLLQPDDIE